MIRVEHLTKYYGDVMALNDLSFEIDEGHVYGFLGANGAGKSTTMNIMTGCLSATDGKVSIDLYFKLREGSLTSCAANAASSCPGGKVLSSSGDQPRHWNTLFILHSLLWLFCSCSVFSIPMVVYVAHLCLHLSFVKILQNAHNNCPLLSTF